MGVDDGVADLELDALDFALDLEVLQELLFGDVGDGCPSFGSWSGEARSAQVCR
jgi:hypothetical protein